ncbi:hypothetical protein F511_28065 [Dorcoceras hygrometricum]|uniref:Uncharacterized protein n=1 Tax=Dorcoceras hygrometricum TaxID=472368 RepID=A0A2Z7AHI3_9LAMI|nr:hypothetical protein F511_28065 [Dorcoceras hygrometricum]
MVKPAAGKSNQTQHGQTNRMKVKLDAGKSNQTQHSQTSFCTVKPASAQSTQLLHSQPSRQLSSPPCCQLCRQLSSQQYNQQSAVKPAAGRSNQLLEGQTAAERSNQLRDDQLSFDQRKFRFWLANSSSFLHAYISDSQFCTSFLPDFNQASDYGKWALLATMADPDPVSRGHSGSPRPETRILHQSALEGLTNLARTESPRHADRNKSNHMITGGGAADGGDARGGRRPDTASRGTTTIVTPKSQFRTCPTDHGKEPRNIVP